MKVSALRKRAVADGVGDNEIEAAVDSDKPRDELVALIIERSKSGPGPATEEVRHCVTGCRA
eukprot:SAG22_NODE_16172_length_331_cov_1.077586_1_plen_62_part_00